VISLSTRQTIILIVIFLITSISLIALDQQHRLDAARSPAEALVHPFEAAMNEAGDSIRGLTHRSSSTTQQQLQQVTAERDRLLAENARLKDLQEQVAELQKQLDFKQSRPGLTVVTASLVGQDPNGTKRIFVIDRGSNDGIQTGMAVISPDFFVGQVTDVSPDRARVTLDIDSASQVGAMLESNNADGVLFGQWQSGGQMVLKYLDPASPVNIGDVVVTSGRTERVPKGLVVGKVSAIHRNVQSAELNVDVQPLIDFNSLQSVMVILSDGSQP
jgi:rod shape-determining protein MreC